MGCVWVSTRSRRRILRRDSAAEQFGWADASASAVERSTAFVRDHLAEDGTRDVVVSVSNLSATPQPAAPQLPAAAGAQPVELTGGVPFPPVEADQPYRLTLPGYGTFWFSISEGAER